MRLGSAYVNRDGSYNVYLDAYPASEEEKSRTRELLERVTARHEIGFFDTRDLLTGCEACTLEDDGHLAEEGHRRLARFVDAALGQHQRVHLKEAAPLDPLRPPAAPVDRAAAF